jgi:excisionase family DNA binding protein
LTHRSKPIKLEAIMEEWLKTKEAAEYLQVHPKTLYRYVKAGKLRQYQPGGVGRPRFKREELDALLQGEGESVNEDANELLELGGYEGLADQVSAARGGRQRGISFSGPVFPQNPSEDYLEQLKEILKEISEIHRRSEEIRRVVEELVRREERRR